MSAHPIREHLPPMLTFLIPQETALTRMKKERWDDGAEKITLRFPVRQDAVKSREAYLKILNAALQSSTHSLETISFESHSLTLWNQIHDFESPLCQIASVTLYLFCSIFTLGLLPVVDWLWGVSNPNVAGELVYQKNPSTQAEERHRVEVVSWSTAKELIHRQGPDLELELCSQK